MTAPEPLTAAKGARVELTFKVNGISFRFLGSVQWTDANGHIGISFSDMIARRRQQLAEVIAEIEAAEKAKMEKAEQESAAQQKAAHDSNESAERTPEDGQKSAGKPHGSLAHAPSETAADKQAETTQQPSTSNRRAHVRLEINSIATIFLVKVGSRLKGSIVDLSEGGCRIRCDERFPVGIYTRVETEFRFESIPFLLGGVVQAIHNQREVGIRFLDMSDRKRQQLTDLVEEIRSMQNSSESALED